MREVQQHHEAGGPLHQRADGGAVVGAHDQIAFPVAGHGSVIDVGGPLGNHDHVRDLAPRVDAALVPALGAASAQTVVQFPAQLTAALHIQRLVDRLV